MYTKLACSLLPLPLNTSSADPYCFSNQDQIRRVLNSLLGNHYTAMRSYIIIRVVNYHKKITKPL